MVYEPVGVDENGFFPTRVEEAMKSVMLQTMVDHNNVVNLFNPSFGVIGNGVADDTLAVQRFFDYLAANGGRGVVVPPLGSRSTFKLTDTITVTAATHPFSLDGGGSELSSRLFWIQHGVEYSRFDSIDGEQSRL